MECIVQKSGLDEHKKNCFRLLISVTHKVRHVLNLICDMDGEKTGIIQFKIIHYGA